MFTITHQYKFIKDSFRDNHILKSKPSPSITQMIVIPPLVEIMCMKEPRAELVEHEIMVVEVIVGVVIVGVVIVGVVESTSS